MKAPKNDILLEGPTRSLVEWTPTLLRSARLTSDSGSLRLAADLCDELLTDERIGGNLGTRVRGLLGLPLAFNNQDDDAEENPVSQALEQDWWTMFPETELAELVTWGLLLGVGLGEQVWGVENGRLVPTLKVWHPRFLRYDWQLRAWRLTTENAGEITIEPEHDMRWIMFTPYGSRRPWSRGLWRSLSLWWMLKRFAVHDWARYSEVHGSPTRIGVTPQNAKREDRVELATDLEQLGRETSMSLPHGFDVKLVEATANTWMTFKEQVGAANAGTSVAILGQTLTSEVSGGSLAAAKVHDHVRQDLIESDEQTLSTTLRASSIKPWTELNFGNVQLAPWVRYEVAPPNDEKLEAETKKTRAEAMEALSRVIASLAAQGIEVDVAALAEEFGVPVKAQVSEVKAKSLELCSNLFENAEAFSLDLVKSLNKRIIEAITLSSGDPAKDAPGFVDGQGYADRLVKTLSGGAQASLDDELSAVRALIEGAESLTDLQEGLVELYADLDDSQRAEKLEKALILAELAGRTSVLEDL